MGYAELEAAGWTRLPTRNFSTAVGPAWVKGERGSRVVALLAEAAIANDHLGMVHGGALMTFADIALGVGAADAVGEPRFVTAQLQYQFAGAAPIGSLITCAPEVVRRTSQLVFVRGLVKADDQVIGSTEAIFKMLAARPAS